MDEILALQDRRIEAMLKSDAQTLEEIIADDLVYTHTTARLDTKASFIDAVKSGKSIYNSLELSAREVQNLGLAQQYSVGSLKTIHQNHRPESQAPYR